MVCIILGCGGATDLGGMYEGSSSFCLEYRIWGEGWALGYNSMKFWDFLNLIKLTLSVNHGKKLFILYCIVSCLLVDKKDRTYIYSDFNISIVYSIDNSIAKKGMSSSMNSSVMIFKKIGKSVAVTQIDLSNYYYITLIFPDLHLLRQ